jgi:hypothetical protein
MLGTKHTTNMILLTVLARLDIDTVLKSNTNQHTHHLK